MLKKKIKDYYEENRPLLVFALDSEKFPIPETLCEAAASRGAVNYLGRWPAHIFAAFIAASLIIATIIFFGIISAIITIPSGVKYRTSRNIDSNDEPNLYFVKHENRSWSEQELCYIETTARNYKNLSVYLINLLADNRTERILSKLMLQLLEDDKNELEADEKSRISATDINLQEYKSMMKKFAVISGDKKSRENLAAFNANVKNIDVSIGRFFNGSRLAKVHNRLNQGMIEMAARAYVLWNFPGVSVDPVIYPNLGLLDEYLCSPKEMENGCKKGETVTVEVNGNIQASFLPCQSFLDHLINKISMNEFSDEKSTVTKATNDFCGRSSKKCHGVKLLNGVSETGVLKEEKFDCPTIFPNEQTTEDLQAAINWTNL